MSLIENNSFAPQESYLRLFLSFLRFGLLAWGGPVAQIAMIRHEFVEEEHWISPERFNRILADFTQPRLCIIIFRSLLSIYHST